MASALPTARRIPAAAAGAALAPALGAPAAAPAADLGWSGVQVLSSQGQPGTAPNMAMNPSGQAVIAWNETDGSGNTRVRVRFRQPGENFGNPSGGYSEAGPVYASAPGANAGAPGVAIDPNGNV